jgi:hypothetical protein
MTGDRFRALVANIPEVRSHTATFVRMDGNLAVVNTGDTQIKLPAPGFFPPRTGMTVQVEWRNGRGAVVGPAVTRNPLGTITGTGSPLATVDVDGVSHLLPYQSWYTPVVDDVVSIDWVREVIVGKLSTSPTPEEEPADPGTSVSAFDVNILAQASGKWSLSYSNYFGGSEVWAGNTTHGVWVYGNAFRDGVGAGATINRVWINLPLISQLGNCEVGVHDLAALSGAPGVHSTVPLNPRGGWVELPVSFGTYLLSGGRGIGVTAGAGGLTKWRGAPSPDSWSGALRVQGTR